MEKKQIESSTETPCYLAVHSTDTKFMVRLIKWLADQDVKVGSTMIRVHDMDPYEEVDMLKGQIEGMTIRIHEAEKGRF